MTASFSAASSRSRSQTRRAAFGRVPGSGSAWSMIVSGKTRNSSSNGRIGRYPAWNPHSVVEPRLASYSRPIRRWCRQVSEPSRRWCWRPPVTGPSSSDSRIAFSSRSRCGSSGSDRNRGVRPPSPVLEVADDASDLVASDVVPAKMLDPVRRGQPVAHRAVREQMLFVQEVKRRTDAQFLLQRHQTLELPVGFVSESAVRRW